LNSGIFSEEKSAKSLPLLLYPKNWFLSCDGHVQVTRLVYEKVAQTIFFKVKQSPMGEN
jgi:hypothetical protein